MIQAQALHSLIERFELDPILVDVGAAAQTPPVWSPIAARSSYLGFDPDSRELPPQLARDFKSAHVLPLAVVADERKDVEVFLTRSPQCSSTLRPDLAALANYEFAPLFEVESKASCPATNLEAALKQVGLNRIDWLKCDTQGTDGRLVESLPTSLQSGIFALDIEPGLVDAYQGEDLWAPLHSKLLAQGFWPSRLEVKGVARGREQSLTKSGTSWKERAGSVRPSPVWIEARYLRTVESLNTTADPKKALLLGLFALLDEQSGFALDVASWLEEQGEREAAEALRKIAMDLLESQTRQAKLAKIAALPRRVASKLKRVITGARP